MLLKEYQREAIEKLKKTANELLELTGNKTIVFEAPTGSGKTLMMAEFLKEFIESREDDRRFSFVWTAPRQLHSQSKEKLEKYYFDSKALKCSNFEDLSDKEIGENEILFLNWESINKADNIYIRDNEQDFNLSCIIDNTVAKERNVILIIDESHHGASTETSLGLVTMLQPKIAIDVSATPDRQGDEHIKVYREKVIAEGMIKKRIALNPGFKNIIGQRTAAETKVASGAAETTNELIIKAALEKRNELKTILEKCGAAVNPLMLIQLPDRKQGIEDVQEEVVNILKENHGITTQNGKLAVYLSEDKANLENITKNDGEAEVMIFKQAIALGWDCPRASILVLFRDWRSITFSVQTLGRIMRMPELKHYENDALNTGIVFTNLSDISIQEDIAGSYLTINYSARKKDYQGISLHSVHSKRFKEEERLSPQFILDFLEAAKNTKLSEKIDCDVKTIEVALISDGTIANPDKLFEHLEGGKDEKSGHSGGIVTVAQTEKEIQVLFDLFVRGSLSPLAPQKRSIGRVKDAIYRFLQFKYPDKFEYGGEAGQKVCLAPKNKQHFHDAINKAKEIYMDRVGKGKKELVADKDWEVPTSLTFDNSYASRNVKKSLMEPYYEAMSASGPEKEFVNHLEAKAAEIEWWFKNGQRDGTFFAVPYEENGEQKPFYVDWIVKYKDGRIGLFDTKAGITAKDAKERAEGLAKYIAEQKGKKLFGGIVIQKDGSWRINEQRSYSYKENDLSEWEYF